MTVRRRKFIRIISYLIALCVVFAASGVFTARAKSDYESTLERVRLDGLVSLTEYSREISSGLRLLAVSADESIQDSSSYVSARAVGAMGSLGCFYSEKVDNMNRFFSGVYDFSESFSGDEPDRKAAVRLSDYTQEMYYHLSDLTNAVMSNQYSLTEFRSVYEKNTKPYFEDVLDFVNGNEDEIFGIVESSALSGAKNCAFLSGRETVSPVSAKKTASKLTDIDTAVWRCSEACDTGFEIYRLTSGKCEVDVCKAGGIISRIINPQPCDGIIYGIEDARKKAADILAICGFENTVEIHCEKSEFTASFTFVPELNGILHMPSAIKIEICLASGIVTYLDASDYIKNFRTVGISAERSVNAASLPFGLTAEKTCVCVADIDGREKLCILAVCPFEEEYVHIYIDYHNGKVLKTE